MLKTTVILLCLLYTLGIVASLYANTYTETQKLLMLLFAFLFSFIVYFFQFYKPLIELRQKHVKMLFSHLLDGLRKKYKEVNPGPCEIRINVMKLRRKYFQPWKRFLKIDFYCGDYSEAELEQKYLVNVGCCGSAVKENTIVFFDANQAQAPYRGMTATQRDVTRDVRSILSAPIYRPSDSLKNSPIGVINLDSKSLVTSTGFKDSNIQALVPPYAEVIGPFLP